MNRIQSTSPWQFVVNKLAVVMSILIIVTTVYAQRGRGTILGAVTDAGGAVVPGAVVTVTSTATNVASTTTTNTDGNFTVPNLEVGGYTLTVAKDGFKKALRSGITLEVDQRAQIDVGLETGAVSEVIEVSSQTSLVDTTTATFGKVIENRRVQELPVNGRNALSLVLLAPAVQSGVGPTASGFADRGTQVSMIRINGSPFATNNLVVDGLSSVNAYLPDVNINPNVDSVQGFKVQTNTMRSVHASRSATTSMAVRSVVRCSCRSGSSDRLASMTGATGPSSFTITRGISSSPMRLASTLCRRRRSAMATSRSWRMRPASRS